MVMEAVGPPAALDPLATPMEPERNGPRGGSSSTEPERDGLRNGSRGSISCALTATTTAVKTMKSLENMVMMFGS